MLITLKWESMTTCHIGDFIYSSFITELKWDDRFWYPWPLTEKEKNLWRDIFSFTSKDTPSESPSCFRLCEDINYPVLLGFFFFWIIPVSCLFSWQIRKLIQVRSEVLKARQLHFSAFNNVLKCSIFRGLHVCFSPVEPCQPSGRRGCDWCVHSKFSSPTSLPDALIFWRRWSRKAPQMAITLDFEVLSHSSLGGTGRKRGKQKCLVTFLQYIRSDQLILEEDRC